MKLAGESFWSLSLLWKLFETIGQCVCARGVVSLNVGVRSLRCQQSYCGLCARVTSFANSQANSCRDVRTMESCFMTSIKFKLVTNRNVYVKCVHVCRVFRWINCACKFAVFWVKPWKFCGATFQYFYGESSC